MNRKTGAGKGSAKKFDRRAGKTHKLNRMAPLRGGIRL